MIKQREMDMDLGGTEWLKNLQDIQRKPWKWAGQSRIRAWETWWSRIRDC